MNIISLNCIGIASPSKKHTLSHLLEPNNHAILLLQETLGDGDVVCKILENLLNGWYFLGIDASWRFRGLALG